MKGDQIAYKGGFKYQLADEYSVETAVKPTNIAQSPLLHLDTSGRLTIKKFYAWDGPSGPTLDRPNFMRGSLVHDALYQLMRMEQISLKEWRKEADKELRRICIQDGMWRIKAWAVYWGVRRFGRTAADPDSRKSPRTAPKVTLINPGP
ncbi:MAG: hypothetical protein V3T49_02195 [Dehalococcoidia bacterium]